MNQQQQLKAPNEFKTNFRPVPKYPKSPSKMLNYRPGVEPTPLKPLFNFAARNPAVNFQTPEQVNVIMAHLAGNQVLGGRVSNSHPPQRSERK